MIFHKGPCKNLELLSGIDAIIISWEPHKMIELFITTQVSSPHSQHNSTFPTRFLAHELAPNSAPSVEYFLWSLPPPRWPSSLGTRDLLLIVHPPGYVTLHLTHKISSGFHQVHIINFSLSSPFYCANLRLTSHYKSVPTPPTHIHWTINLALTLLHHPIFGLTQP